MSADFQADIFSSRSHRLFYIFLFLPCCRLFSLVSAAPSYFFDTFLSLALRAFITIFFRLLENIFISLLSLLLVSFSQPPSFSPLTPFYGERHAPLRHSAMPLILRYCHAALRSLLLRVACYTIRHAYAGALALMRCHSSTIYRAMLQYGKRRWRRMPHERQTSAPASAAAYHAPSPKPIR